MLDVRGTLNTYNANGSVGELNLNLLRLSLVPLFFFTAKTFDALDSMFQHAYSDFDRSCLLFDMQDI